MKKIGLIGGISWVSTADYYRYTNSGINERLGGLNYAECIIDSFNYTDIKRNNDKNDWDKTLEMITTASEHLKSSRAEAIVLCANAMHMIADRLQEAIKTPVIHIATATANEIKKQCIHKVGLLGTKFTMEQDFFISKLKKQEIEAIIPDEDDLSFILYTIFEELGKGLLSASTKTRYISIINKLIARGADVSY